MLTIEDFKHLINKNVEEARKEIPDGYFICIIEDNGRTFYRTWDFNPYRICVVINNGIITKIDSLN